MRKNLSLILGAVALIAVVTLLLDFQIKPAVKTIDDIAASGDMRAHQAPDFTVSDIYGRDISLAKLRGRIVILHFWASWCPPCLVEFPKLVELSKANENDITLLAVSSDETAEAVRKFYASQLKSAAKPGNIVMVWDRDRKITHDLFQTFAYPQTIVIDGSGRMVRKIAGDADWTSPAMKAYIQFVIQSPVQAGSDKDGTNQDGN